MSARVSPARIVAFRTAEVAAMIGLSAIFLSAVSAAATTLTVRCQSKDPAVPGDMMIVYEGEAKAH